MPKVINVERYCWHHTERFVQELVTDCELVDDIVVIGACLIILNPASIKDFYLAALDHLLK
jgi:hypothetical protein